MGCCSTIVTELSLSFQVTLYKLNQTSQPYVFNISEVVKSTFDKEMGVSLLQILTEDSNEHFQSLTQTKEALSKCMYYLYTSRIRAQKSYKQIQSFQPYDFPQLSRIAIIDISEALKADISRKILKKVTKKMNDFNGKVISVVALKEEMDKAKDPSLTKDIGDSSNNDEDETQEEENNVKDDELIIELPLSKQDFAQVKGLLFQMPKSKQNKNQSNPMPIQINNNPNQNEEMDNEGDQEDKDEKLNQLTQIKKIFITKSKFNTIDQFKRLLKILGQYNSLRKFGFFNNFITNEFEGWELLGDLFSENSSIRWIDLHSSTLYDYQLCEITRGLQSKRVRSLDLSENFLSSEGIKVLSKWLASNKTMQSLNMSRNAVCQFRPEGVRLITEALSSHPNIKSLNFSHMDLTQSGAHFKNFLSANKSIEELNLRNLKLNYKDFKDISEGILASSSLKKLDIGMNDMGGDKSLQEIANVIANSKGLESINLDQMNLNMDNYDILFESIEKNTVITAYSLSFNPNVRPKTVLNFFMKKEGITRLTYVPWNPEDEASKGKSFTLEEKKLIEKFTSTWPKCKLRTQLVSN